MRALAHPLRLRIIRELYDGARSNKELATALGEDPATVLYHVRTLARTGFVKPAGTRPGARGSVEKLYGSTGKSWKVDVDAGLPASTNVRRARSTRSSPKSARPEPTPIFDRPPRAR